MTKLKLQFIGAICTAIGIGFIMYTQPHLKEIQPAVQELLASNNYLSKSLLASLIFSFAIPAVGAATLPLMIVAFMTGFMPIEFLFGALFVSGIVYSIFGIFLVSGIGTKYFIVSTRR